MQENNSRPMYKKRICALLQLRIEAVQDVLMIARRAYAALIAAICTCCMPAYMALAAEPVNIVHDPAATYGVKAGTYKSLRVSDGQYTLTLPSYVDKVKVTCVGAGGGPSHSGYLSTKAVYGGGGGAVVQNTVINIGSNKTLTIVVGKAGSWGENGGASYVIYNGQQYGTAAGGKGATTSAAGAPGGSGGGVGGAVRISGVINNAGSGVDGTAGGRTYVQNASGGHITAGGGASWKPGLHFNWVNGAFAVSSSYTTACGSGAAVYHSQSESTNYTSYAGDGLVAVSYAVQVTGISISRSSLSLTPGSSANLSATVSPADAQNKSVVWSSSNANVATVSSSGKVTGVANGTTIITVKSADKPSISRTCTVTVTTPASGVTVTPESAVLNKGETKQLSAVVAPSSATNKSVTWTSDNPGVASANSSGLVTAVSDGTAVITAKTSSGGYTDTCKVTVKTPVSGISISSSSIELNKGETQQLTATVTPPDATNKKVVWSSTDDAIAEVSQDGTVTAAGGGTTVVTATTEDGSYSAKCSVVVNVPVTGIQFNDTSSSVGVGNETRLGYTITPPDATNKTVTWQSSDAAVAWIDEATGIVTPISPGGAEITATTEDGRFTATTLLVVTNTMNLVRLKLVTESGEYPAFGTVHFKSAGNVIEYPGTMIGGNGEMDASIPSSPSGCRLGVSLLNTLISGMTVEPDTEDVSSTPLYMVEGDFNSDNVIDGADWALLVQRKLYGGGETQYGLVGDMNYDGAVDDLDLLLFNSPITHTGAKRFMSRGYAIHDFHDGESLKKSAAAPAKSIIAINRAEDGRYEVSLSEPSDSINMFQLSLEGNISDASYSAPDGFKLLGSHIEDGRTVMAIGTDKEGGDTIPSGEPYVTVAAPDTPCVKYGANDTTMLLAAEEGVEAVSMESGKNAADTDSVVSSGGSSGCNAGVATAGLFVVVPLVVFRSFKSFTRGNNK